MISKNDSPDNVAQRIKAGLKEAENGIVKPWPEVKRKLLKKITNSQVKLDRNIDNK